MQIGEVGIVGKIAVLQGKLAGREDPAALGRVRASDLRLAQVHSCALQEYVSLGIDAATIRIGAWLGERKAELRQIALDVTNRIGQSGIKGIVARPPDADTGHGQDHGFFRAGDTATIRDKTGSGDGSRVQAVVALIGGCRIFKDVIKNDADFGGVVVGIPKSADRDDLRSKGVRNDCQCGGFAVSFNTGTCQFDSELRAVVARSQNPCRV